MKKINLNQLSMSWNERKRPQKFGRYAAMLIMLLTLGVGQMWAATATLYIDIENANWAENGNSIYVWDSSKNKNIKFSSVSTNLYKSDEEVTQGITLYFKQTKQDDPDTKYNEATGTYNGTNNCFKLSGWTAGSFSYNVSTVTATNEVYYDNSTSNFSGNFYFVIGHDEPSTYSKVYPMTNLSGTNYYHASVEDSWSDATYYAVVVSSTTLNNTNTNWGISSLYSKGNNGNTNAYTGKYDFGGSNHVYITTASGDNQNMSISYKDAGIGYFNKTQTLHLMFSNNGGSTYSDLTTTASAWHGTITAERKYLYSDYGTVVDHTGASKETLSSSAYAKDAIIGSNYVLAESSTATGYTFAGWGNTSSATPDGNSSKTISSVSAANNIYAFFKANQYTITLKRNDDTDNSDTQTATYGETAATRAGSLPTRSGYGFDGYWTAASGGTKVIDKNGNWVSNVSGFTDSNGKWICTSAQTLHAHWLEVGYYMVGEFTGGDWNAITANKFDNTTQKCTINVANHDIYSGSSYLSEFKICHVQANTSSALNETLYGKDATIGKGNTTASGLTSGPYVAAIKEQLYYDGDYVFTLTTSPLGVSVQVPVVDQLQIYSSAPSGAIGIGNYDWSVPVSNVVSKTITLARGTTYDFKAAYESVHYGKNSTTITRDANNTDLQLANSEGNVKITADLKGDYQFKFNTSNHQLTVIYPTRRLVTYSISTIGSGTGTASSLTATNNDDSNVNISTLSNYVADGNNVTFTAPAAKSGYTWKGWYSVADPSADYSQNKLSEGDNNSFIATISEDYTAYAVYAEDKHSVTVNKTSGGTITATSIDDIGIATTGSVTAEADEGYYFVGWTLDDGVTQASLTNDNVTSTITINATADSKTITANFAVRYAIYGSFASENTGDGMPGWTTPRAFDSYDSENKKYTLNLTALKPNSRYKLKVLDRRNGNSYGPTGDSDISDGTQWTLNGPVNTSAALHFSTKGCGTYTLTTTTVASGDDEGKPTAKIDMPASHTVTYGQVTNNGQNGGSISSVKDDGNYDLSSGGYVAEAGSATFTAGTPTSGYRFVDWRSSSTYGQGTQLSTENPWTLSSPVENKTVYAHYAENMCTVTITANDKTKGSITVAGEAFAWDGTTSVGVYNTKALVVTPVAGYYFSGWTLSTSPDFAVGDATEDGASTTLRGLGGTNGSIGILTANFVELDKVYFRNWNDATSSALWSDVYVYFSITYEEYDKEDCAVTNGSDGYKAQMTLESGNVYWAYVPRATTRSGNDDIAFSNTSYGTGIKFYTGEGVMRSDYRTSQNLFVPRSASNYTRNSTKYYNGYWKHHNLEPGTYSGYQIKRYNGSDYVTPQDNGTDRLKFIVKDENTIQYLLRVDNPSIDYQKYKIFSDGNIDYITYNTSAVVTGYDITNTNYSGVKMTEYLTGSPYFRIDPTTQNNYTLIIDQSSDIMKLTVDYPVALNDYRIVHTYNSGAKKAYSDIIKSADAGSAITASMYINTSGSPTLSLEKCTNVNPVTWTAQTSSDVWSTYSGSLDKNGVYQFDVTITAGNSNTNSSISNIQNIKIYDGEFYIKTDIAPGGWTAWEANVMEKNTITFNSADSKTFDRSFCHWVEKARSNYPGSATNVKCVIANAYNIAVSDTVEDDAIIGDGANKYQTLPYPANVRFSYNSVTNELKRTYLNITGTDSLILEGNTLESGTVYMIHNPSTDDAYSNNKAAMGSLSNFTYSLDVKAREKARVRLSSKYDGHLQDLIGETGKTLDGEANVNTVEIMGGLISEDTYKTIRIIYDFKTNYVMAAWLADGLQINTTKALNSDMMIIREGQGDARQITFGDKGNITEVDTVYGVMKFEKSTLNNSSLSPYERDLYWISFPFDVKLSDAFGMGTYGTHWIIERYDGKTRAQKGFWADSESNWKFVTPYQRDSGFVMNANEGYILALDLDELGEGSLVWDNGMTEAYLYFPSKDAVGSIQKTSKTVTFANQSEYECTINRPTPDGNRTIKDSYWHCIGVPSYAEKDTFVNTNYNESDIPNVTNWSTQDLPFLYEWNSGTNTLTPKTTTSFIFKPMYSYLVQYSNNTMVWSDVNATPASVAARMTETPNLEYELALLREDDEQDRTYVRMTDDVNVSTGFEFNYDLSKEMNRNRGNIWTVTSDATPVAGNSQPHPLTTTIVPVGVKIAANGEYTFSMPEGTNGGDVWLIDNANSSRTNLGLMDYTVNLTTGTYEGRFSLEFPVQNVVTDIENAANANANANADAVRKVFVGGQLYIIRDGVIYNASGARVQ